MYICRCKTPAAFSDIVLFSDGEYLTGLLFEGSEDMKKFAAGGAEKDLPVFWDAQRWLDIYFSGRDPAFIPKLKLEGLSPFRAEVLERLLRIPFGESVSYGEIARELAEKRGGPVSSQAVGGAVGSNPICLIIPCHRVLGAGGKLTGYGGGLGNKKELLKLEGIGFC